MTRSLAKEASMENEKLDREPDENEESEGVELAKGELDGINGGTFVIMTGSDAPEDIEDAEFGPIRKF